MFSQRTRDLHKAIYADNYAKVIQCLDVGPKRERKKLVDQVDNDGYTPLSTAARFGRINIVTALLDRGAVIDAAAPPEKRRLAHWINRIHLHVVGPRGDHQGSARHRLLNCRHLARHLVSFLLVKERVTVH